MKRLLFTALVLIGISAFGADLVKYVGMDGTSLFRVDGSGNVVAAGTVSSAYLAPTAATTSVTNNQILSLGTSPVIRVSTDGQSQTVLTNTIAEASSSYVGQTYVIVNVGSNSLLVVDSAPVYNSGATLGTRDSSTYVVSATTAIVQTATSNN